MRIKATRRRIMAGTAFGAFAATLPRAVFAQAEPIKIGTLTPLTGSGGPYGPVMAKAVQAVAEQVNSAGGVLGRRLQIISEDDQTNPEAGVRAARKLIDVDRVSAILGTWASSVTTAVAPLCWESKTFLCTVSGADSITQLPHQGWLIRTQPNTTLQGQKLAQFMLDHGAKRVFMMMGQTPFTQSTFDNVAKGLAAKGAVSERMIYDDKKPSLRSEVDQALRFNPDTIFAGGYTPDTAVLLKDLYRAGYKGKVFGMAYSINQKLIESVGQNDIVEGVFGQAPSTAQAASGHKRLVELVKVDDPDPYTCQIFDHINLVAMAMAHAKAATGEAIKASVRAVAQGGGTRVDNAVDGIKLIAAGTKVDYDGASGPCDFTDLGDIVDCQFRYEQIKAGKVTVLRIA
ncbi:MAG: ABC transporter substrate-binding protein [Alphaproteobacteria bacterium]|nr:ABC transporter substrate-binding protein [Alphaproteobacteria bacterium]